MMACRVRRYPFSSSLRCVPAAPLVGKLRSRILSSSSSHLRFAIPIGVQLYQCLHVLQASLNAGLQLVLIHGTTHEKTSGSLILKKTLIYI